MVVLSIKLRFIVVFISILLLNSSLSAQGIQFQTGLTWQQILEKARAENKYIFVDCYTTWCAPCKIMQNNVFPLQEIGSYFNERFISVKIQMDKTKNDNDYVKGWYDDAGKIQSQFTIEAYPTFLFLNSSGKPMHRAAGSFSPEQFLSIAKDALDPATQSYTVAEKYDLKKLDTNNLRRYALKFVYTNPELAQKMAVSYLRSINSEAWNKDYYFILKFKNNREIQKLVAKYIDRLPEEKIYTKENILFMVEFLNSSNDRIFKLLLHSQDKVNEAIFANLDHVPNLASKWVENIIYKENVEGLIRMAETHGNVPLWSLIFKSVKTKYGSVYADQLTLQAKMNWYRLKNDTINYVRNVVQYVEKYGLGQASDLSLNNYAWEVFLYSDKKDELKKALNWSSVAVRINPSPAWIDTYANILFKLGKAQTAIKWEAIAAGMDTANREIQNNFKRMKDSKLSWTNK